jgi:hypothetical protein
MKRDPKKNAEFRYDYFRKELEELPEIAGRLNVSPEEFLRLARDPNVSDHELYSQIKGWEKGQVVDGPWTVEGRYKHFKDYYEFAESPPSFGRAESPPISLEEGGIYQDELKIPLKELLELARDPYVTDEELYNHIKPMPGERMVIKGHPLGKRLRL